MSSASGGAEKRAYERHPVQVTAWLSGTGFTDFPCVIRDYCRGGLFLSWVEEADRAPPLARGDAVTVVFADPGSGRPTRLQATVARALTSGAGLAFAGDFSQTVEVLDRIAAESTGRRGRSEETSDHGLDVAVVSQQALAAVQRALEPLLDGLFRRLEERVFQAARDAGSDAEQRVLFDVVTQLGQQAQTMRGAMAAALADGVARLGGGPGQQGRAAERASGNELSLVDKEEFEEFLLVADIVSRVEPGYRERLWCIERRLSRLVGAPVERSDDPFAPAALCHAFAEALAPLELTLAHRALAYEVFEETVLARLGDLYAELDELLRGAGLLPGLEHEPELPGTPLQRNRARRDDEPDGLAATHGGVVVVGEATSGGGAGEGAAGAAGTPPADSAAVSLAGGAAAPGPAAPAPGAAPGSVPHFDPAAGQTQRASAPAPGLGAAAPGVPPDPQAAFRAAQALLDLKRQVAAQPAAGAAPAAAREAAAAPRIDLAALIDAIDELEGSIGEPSPAFDDPDELQQRLQALAAGHPGVPAGAVIGAEEQDALRLANGLMNALRQDALLSDPMRELLPRLSGAVHKLALRDERFLADPAHPARRFLNAIAEVEVGDDAAHGEQTVAQVQRLVETAAERIDRDPESLASLAEEVEGLVTAQAAARAERLQQLLRECERQQQEATAGGRTRAPRSSRAVAREWQVWLDRARRLRVGDRLALNRPGRRPQRVSLAWIGEDDGPYVFVDGRGAKAASMTLQELAMHLRRGTARLLDAADAKPFERALMNALYGVHQDIGNRALADTLTGLANRQRLERALSRAVAEAAGGEVRHVFASIRLTGVDPLVEAAGERARESLLRKVAGVYRTRLPEGAVLARSGELEFGLLLFNTRQEQVQPIADDLAALTRKIRINYEGRRFSLGAAIRLAEITTGAPAAPVVLERVSSDAAEAAADSGAETLVWLDLEATVARAEVVNDVDWTAWLAQTLERGTPPLMVTPVVALEGGRPGSGITAEVQAAAEVDGRLVALPPEVAEAGELREQLAALDRLVLRRVLEWMARRPDVVNRLGGCSVNLSAASVADPAFAEMVLELLTETLVPPSRLCLEIGEAAAAASYDKADRLVRTLREFGCRFALDRFGAGESAAGNVGRLPVDLIKVDPVFVRDIDANAASHALVKSVNEIGHLTGKRTVALGVDREDVLAPLAGIGIDCIEGTVAGAARRLEEVG